MPKRQRGDTDSGGCLVDDLPASKTRRIANCVGEQLKRIRRKSEQDERDAQSSNKTCNNKSNSSDKYDNFGSKKRGSKVTSLHIPALSIKTKTMEQHTNFLMRENVTSHIETDSYYSDDEDKLLSAYKVKPEPKSPVKKSVIVFGKGSSMYNPIVIFDGRSVDLEDDGIEVTDRGEEQIEIINLDETQNNDTTDVHVDSHSKSADKQPVLSVTVSGQTRQVKTSLVSASGTSSNNGSKRCGGKSITKTQDKNGTCNNATQIKREFTDNTAVSRQQENRVSSENNHTSTGIELSRSSIHRDSAKEKGLRCEITNKQKQYNHDTDRSKQGRNNATKNDYTNTDMKTGNKIPVIGSGKLTNKTDGQTSGYKHHSRNSSHKRNKKKKSGVHRGSTPEVRYEYNNPRENFFRGQDNTVDVRPVYQQPDRYENDPYMYRYDEPVLSDGRRWRPASHKPPLYWRDRFYTRHQIDITWFPVKCDVCHSHFRSRNQFLNHLSKFQHCPFDFYNTGDVSMYLCSYCPYETRYLVKIMQHYCSRHSYYFRQYGYRQVLMQAYVRS